MEKLELIIEFDGQPAKRMSVGNNGLRIGRSSSNDIPVRDEELSRNHCMFENAGDGGIRITDLASANGTFVNGVKMGRTPVDLKAGDTVTLGGVVVSVVDGDVHFSDKRPREKGAHKKDEAKVDLGFDHAEMNADVVPPPTNGNRKRRLVNLLWVVAMLLITMSVYVIFMVQDEEKPEVREMVERKPELLEVSYEEVNGDSESVFRYYMALSQDGTLQVTMDDLSGDGRHLNRSEKISAASRKELLEMLSDAAFTALEPEYVGPEEEPPKLRSRCIRYLTTEDCRSVSVVNMPEPEAFRSVSEKLKTFSMNELGIRALEYSRSTLIEMATSAAATGKMKWEDRDVEYGNVFASLCAYREALADLETINPKPPEYETYRAAKERAEKELDQRYRNQRFAVEQATSVGDWERAKNELKVLCELIPDRKDERNREASVKLLDVERRLNKRGGAR